MDRYAGGRDITVTKLITAFKKIDQSTKLEESHRIIVLRRSCSSKIRPVFFDATPSPSLGRFEYYGLVKYQWRKWLLPIYLGLF